MEYIADSQQAMEVLGRGLAAACGSDAWLIYLQGELGSGKTTLVRGFLRGLGYQGRIKSPTYTLVETYELDECRIIHFDFYRIADRNELELIGIRDYFAGHAICLVEWPERAGNALPPPDLRLHFRYAEGSVHAVRLEGCSLRGRHALDAIKQYIENHHGRVVLSD